jgi:4-carboxymuconolactone decarboxylase
MCRIPELRRNELDADGKQLYDEILAARGNIAGPFRVWLHSPEFTRRATRLGEFLRYHTSLPPRPSQLVILITARRQESKVEWPFTSRWHARPVPGELIKALQSDRRPTFTEAVGEAIL